MQPPPVFSYLLTNFSKVCSFERLPPLEFKDTYVYICTGQDQSQEESDGCAGHLRLRSL